VSLLSLAHVKHIALEECHLLPGFVTGPECVHEFQTVRGINCTGINTAYELAVFLILFAKSGYFEYAIFSGEVVQLTAVDNIRLLMEEKLLPYGITIVFEDGAIVVKSTMRYNLHERFNELLISEEANQSLETSPRTIADT
jgi:hypothetical protein